MENQTKVYVSSVISTEVIYEYDVTDIEKFKQMMLENEITDISELWENGLLSYNNSISKFVSKEHGSARGEDFYEQCWSDDDELNEMLESLDGDLG